MKNSNIEQFKLAKLLRVKEVADLLNMSERTVWRMAGENQLPSPIQLGNRLKFWRLTDLEEFIQKKRPA